MPEVPWITRMRERRRTQARRSPSGRLGMSCSGLFSLALALSALLIVLVYANLTHDLPEVAGLPGLFDPPGGLLLQPTRLYDRSGEHLLLSLENPAAPGRTYLRLPPATDSADPATLLPSSLVTATLAAADPTFYQHAGYSLAGIQEGSHPTLAQRLASDFLLQDEPPGLRRALRERLLAAQITSQFGRQKVLEWYLNSAAYGHLAYGADAASRLYLGKPAAQLNLAEASLLAAIALDPGLNPFDAPQSALERQKQIIQKVLELRLATPEQGVQAARLAIQFRPAGPDLDLGPAPAFSRLALRQLEAFFPRPQLERGGLRVLTTLDYDLQTQTACTALTQLFRLRSADPRLTLDGCPAAGRLPGLLIIDQTLPAGLQSDAVVLDPASGQILALVGDPPGSLDAAPLPAHPAGSLASTFVYLTAFTRGSGPATLLWDTPGEVSLDTSQDISVPEHAQILQNFDGVYHGPLRLRLALANDYLHPAGQVLSQVGQQNVWRTAQQLGIPFPEASASPENPFGFRDINLLEASRAFAILANQGTLAGRILDTGDTAAGLPIEAGSPLQPVALSAAASLDSPAARLDWNIPQTRPIITPQLAYLMTDVLKDRAARWPALGQGNPLESSPAAAVRAGRTPGGQSQWVIGYTPQRVTGVWLGYPAASANPPAANSQSQELAEYLQSAATGLWSAIHQAAHRDLPGFEWTPPGGVSYMKVCDPSGLLPTRDCPNLVDEIFLSGSEPIQADTLYRAVQINQETGRLATIFTPPELVAEQVYFIAPPDQAAWMQQTGARTPPEDYDIVSSELPALPDVQISSPEMFAVLRGQVPILGKASGPDFNYYRIQVGPGLNPQDWYLVGGDVQKPVSDGQLGVWDTSLLNGLYAVQLMVVREDQSVERATLLVTVDNLAPSVEITSPHPEEEIVITRRPSPVFSASVQDELEVYSVEFWVDGQKFATLLQAPFAISWKATPGAHTLLVKAFDLAGNSSQAEVKFTVR